MFGDRANLARGKRVSKRRHAVLSITDNTGHMIGTECRKALKRHAVMTTLASKPVTKYTGLSK